MKKILLYAMLIFPSLGLAGDVILPLGMQGSADGQELTYTLRPVMGISVAAPRCSPSFVSVPAEGTISFGGEEFAITGICGKGSSRREILGSNGSKTITLRNAMLDFSGPNKTLSGTLLIGESESGEEQSVGRFYMVE